MSLSSAPNSPQKSRLEPPRKGRFGGGWTRSLTNLRKEAQQSPSSPNSSIQAARPGVKPTSSTTAIPTPTSTGRTPSTPSSNVNNPTTAPKGLRAFFQSFKRSNSTPAPIRSEKILATVPLPASAVRPAGREAEAEVERSSSNGSKERIAHEEEKRDVILPPSTILQEKDEDKAVLEPVDIEPSAPALGEKKAEEEEDPADIPLPASPSLSFESIAPAVIPLAGPLPIDLTGTEPLVRVPSRKSEEAGVPSLVSDENKKDEWKDGKAAREEEVEEEPRAEGDLVTPVTTSSSAVLEAGVGVVGVDRIEEEDEDEGVEQAENVVVPKDTSSEEVELVKPTSMDEQAGTPSPAQVDETDKTPEATSQTQPQTRPTMTLDTSSPTLGRNGSYINSGSTSASAGRGMSSSSSFSSGRTPVSAVGGNGGRASSYQNQQYQTQQQHQQHQQQQQQNRPQYQSQHSYQQQQYQQQQQQQQQQRSQHPQQYQGFSPTTPSSTQSLGRSGSRQIRQSGYGLNKLSIPHSTSYSSRTSSRSPSQKRMSVSPTMYTMGGVFVEAEEIGDADEKRLTEAMFCS